jgi:3-dehydroquinate synthase
MTTATDAERVHVALGERSYDIIVGDNTIDSCGGIIAKVAKSDRMVVITDENVAPHWLARVTRSLESAGLSAKSIVLPPGEHTKSYRQLETLLDELLEQGIDRKTTLIALGGGVIGDLTGFAAAIILRGINFVQIPTTLLSQVDSSVGGKTGIDTRHGKNLVGAFHQPLCVIADTATLDTLPARERRCGYAEVIKYGVINDRDFFDWLLENGERILAGDPDARKEAVVRSCQSKAAVVAEDEKEAGVRALLNLGHTFGHAIEAQVGFDDVLKHGEAVAIGMVMALDMSSRLAVAPESARDELVGHLEKIGLPTTLKGLVGGNWTSSALLEHMGRDKKTEGNKLTFILARGIGQSFVAKDVDAEVVAATLDVFIAEARAACD